LAKSNLSLWSPLNRVARTLPKEEREAWYSVMEEMNFTESKLREDPLALGDRVFARLLKVLNERWFIPRQILFASLPNRDASPDTQNVGEAVWLIIYRICACYRYAFRDAEVLLYEVRCVFPPAAPRPHQHYNDPTSGWAVINVDFLMLEAFDLYSLTDDNYQKIRLKTYPRPGEVRARAWAGPSFRRIFVSPFALLQALRQRVMNEEIRHGINGKRKLRGRPLAVFRPESSAEAAEMLLAAGGRLRREVWEPAASGPEGGGELRRHLAAQAVEEASAQFTAAAVSVTPLFLLAEWKARTAITCLEFFPDAGPVRQKPETPHETAARIAVILLAEQLGLTSPMRLGAASRPDYERLDSLAEALFHQSPEALRMALKEIYRREFVYNEIDEFPFPGIGPNGEYIPVREPPRDFAPPKPDDPLWPTSPRQS
jgi:hypothetical protein